MKTTQKSEKPQKISLKVTSDLLFKKTEKKEFLWTPKKEKISEAADKA